MKIYLLIIFCFSAFVLQAQYSGISKLVYDFPESLITDTLLIPAFEVLPTRGVSGKKLKQVKRVNALSKEHNETQRKLLAKHYPFPYKLVPLADVRRHKRQGHYYFLDYVPMPRQWRHPNPEAMVSMYKRYKATLEIYRITDFQFHYYFYIRDLTTDAAYMPKPPLGHAKVYSGMTGLFKKITKKLSN